MRHNHTYLLVVFLTAIANPPSLAIGASPAVINAENRIFTPTASFTTSVGASIAPTRSHPNGHSYGEWAAKWWQWALETPASISPILDMTGAHCAEGQEDRVWFLAEPVGGDPNGVPVVENRKCTVPADTALFFPLISSYYGAFLSDPPEQRTEQFVRSIVACGNVSIDASIDGIAISNDPNRYFSKTALFDVQLPEDNIFGVDTSIIPELLLSPSVAQGYFVFLRPLRPGVHTIHWTASQNCPFGDFAQEVTYSLTVQKPRR